MLSPTPPKRGRRKAANEDTRQLVYKLTQEGHTQAEIATATGLSVRTVHSIQHGKY